MIESLKDVAEQITKIDTNLKKYVDILYLIGIVFLVIELSCSIVFLCFSRLVTILLPLNITIFSIVSIYRIVVHLFKDSKKSLLIVLVILFGFGYYSLGGNDFQFPLIALAITGAIGVSGKKILISCLIGNILMIVSDFCYVFSNSTESIYADCQERTFFYFGDNTFSIPRYKFNSLTDFAALFFWIAVSYLWIRGKKLTWGEFLALCSFNALIYSFTASNTTLLSMIMVIIISFVMKIWPLIKFKTKAVELLKSCISLAAKSSFILISAFCIVFSFFYDISDPVTRKLNTMLHYRLSLGHRGLVDFGIHFFSSNVPSYGVYTSADNYYFFLDCSYLSLLVGGGILLFLFYICSFTAIQFRSGKYFYGVLLLAICAVSCIQEHHLSELPFATFILLLFADFENENNTDSDKQTAKLSGKLINCIFIPVCILFLIPVIILNYSKYTAIRCLDRLDERAGDIYTAIQSNIDALAADEHKLGLVNAMTSCEYGDVLAEPSDYTKVTGLNWDNTLNDPKSHSYFSLKFNSKDKNNVPAITKYLINDEAEKLIGNGSVVIEYDVSARKVYSVWYSESDSCHAIYGGRSADRTERLKYGVIPEGYSTGK